MSMVTTQMQLVAHHALHKPDPNQACRVAALGMTSGTHAPLKGGCMAAVQEDFGDMAQQKETMQQLVKGWKVCNFQELLEATPLENIKLSKIYQRCGLCLVLPEPDILQAFTIDVGAPYFECA